MLHRGAPQGHTEVTHKATLLASFSGTFDVVNQCVAGAVVSLHTVAVGHGAWAERTSGAAAWAVRTGGAAVWAERTSGAAVWAVTTSGAAVWAVRTGGEAVWAVRTGGIAMVRTDGAEKLQHTSFTSDTLQTHFM